MKYKQKFRDDSSIDNQNLNFNDVIYEKMIQSFQPEVNYIDKVTSMTPLELAIHEKNIIIIEVGNQKCFQFSFCELISNLYTAITFAWGRR